MASRHPLCSVAMLTTLIILVTTQLEAKEIKKSASEHLSLDSKSDLEGTGVEKRDTEEVKIDDNSIGKRQETSFTLKVIHKNATPYRTTNLFVSVGVATTIFHRVSYDSFGVQNNRRFKNLAEALSPAIVRVGGVNSAFMVFVPDGLRYPISGANEEMYQRTFGVPFWGSQFGQSNFEHFNVTSTEWKIVHQFFKDIGWKVNFNLNAFLWNYRNEITFNNVELLFRFCEQENLPFYGFQLPNEPNSYPVKFNGFYRSPEQLSDDWAALEAYQNKTENSFIKDVLRIGPDVTSLSRIPSSLKFLEAFFAAGGWRHQDVLGLHHYYFGPDSTIDDFLNYDHFNTLGDTVRKGRALIEQYSPYMPLHLTETSNAYGGGSATYSHSFASVFIFMDMLGQAALYGADVVNRYTYFSGDFGIMGSYAEPYPDYWVAYLHKTLIEGPVLSANVTDNFDPNLRLYASCVNQNYSKYKGEPIFGDGIVLTYENLMNKEVTLNIPGYTTRELHLFILTGEPDVDDDAMFKSENIYLNGQLLTMISDCVPTLQPVKVKNVEYITLPRYSVGFVVIPQGHGYDCLHGRAT